MSDASAPDPYVEAALALQPLTRELCAVRRRDRQEQCPATGSPGCAGTGPCYKEYLPGQEAIAVAAASYFYFLRANPRDEALTGINRAEARLAQANGAVAALGSVIRETRRLD